jgi:hypothetical protein
LGCIDNYLPYRNTTPLVAPQAGVTRMAAHRSVLPSSARAAVEAVAGVRVAHPVAGFRNYLPDCCDELRAIPWVLVCCSANSIEPFASANRTVTCFRSPSRALRDVRIFSARCFGV